MILSIGWLKTFAVSADVETVVNHNVSLLVVSPRLAPTGHSGRVRECIGHRDDVDVIVSVLDSFPGHSHDTMLHATV